MKNLIFLISLLFAPIPVYSQNPFFDQQFIGFRVYFESVPQPSQIGQISIMFPACRRPFSENFSEFPTEVQRVGSEVTLTYSFWVPNLPSCFSGDVQRYSLPQLLQGQYQLKVRARLIDYGLTTPPRVAEIRTMAQINFQVGEPLATQVPNLTPVGFALMILMMLGVGVFVSGRRYS